VLGYIGETGRKFGTKLKLHKTEVEAEEAITTLCLKKVPTF